MRGDYLGIDMPAHVDALRDGGARFLTDAFRATGALDADGAVRAITELREFRGGSTGRKALLAVEYDRGDLPADLFVKFSRDFDDAGRDGGRTQMEFEVRFALLSPDAGVPDRGAEVPVRRLPRTVGHRAADHRSNPIRGQRYRAALRQVHGLRDARPGRPLPGPARRARSARGHPQGRPAARRTRRPVPSRHGAAVGRRHVSRTQPISYSAVSTGSPNSRPPSPDSCPPTFALPSSLAD